MAIDKGIAKVEFRSTPNLQHALDAMHGSYYFKLLDDACFFAANSIEPDFFVLTANFNISLYRPVQAGIVRAEGRVTKAGATLIFAEASAVDEQGRELARGTGTFARAKARLADVPSYAQAPV